MNTQSPQEAPSKPREKSVADAGNTPGSETAGAAFQDASKRIAEVSEYIRYYIAVQTDAAKMAARNVAFYAVLGVIGLLAAGAVVVVAVVLLLSGIAHGIGNLLGHQTWLGDLIVGAVILGLLGLCAWLAKSKLIGASRRKTVQKYESFQRQQRTRFGHDVQQRADDSGR